MFDLFIIFVGIIDLLFSFIVLYMIFSDYKLFNFYDYIMMFSFFFLSVFSGIFIILFGLS